MFAHQDTLGRLAENVSLREKLALVHSVLRHRHPFIERVAVAVHDHRTVFQKREAVSRGSRVQSRRRLPARIR